MTTLLYFDKMPGPMIIILRSTPIPTGPIFGHPVLMQDPCSMMSLPHVKASISLLGIGHFRQFLSPIGS